MIKNSSNRGKLNNAGFSLVELLVGVTILSIIVVPIMRSFTTSALTSSRAQSMQNATSVAEKVMEEVKTIPGNTIKGDMTGGEIKSFPKATPVKLDAGGNPLQDIEGNDITYNVYRHRYTRTATSGEVFDVYVEVSDLGYEEDAGTADVSDINTVELPELYKIDSEDHFVISWEINNYDASAVENLAYKTNVSKETIKNDGVKTTTVELSGGGTKPEPVPEGESKYKDLISKCDVTYTYNGTELKYSVFTKYAKDIVIEQGKKGNSGPHLYLFYTPSKQVNTTDYFENEEIVIKDNTEVPVANAGEKYRQDLYVILQNVESITTKPKISLEGTNINPPSGSDLVVNGDKRVVPTSVLGHNNWIINEADDSYLYTNLPSTDSNPSSQIDATLYKSEKKQRIYGTRVIVYKTGTYSDSDWPADGDGKKKLAELNSTMRVH